MRKNDDKIEITNYDVAISIDKNEYFDPKLCGNENALSIREPFCSSYGLLIFLLADHDATFKEMGRWNGHSITIRKLTSEDKRNDFKNITPLVKDDYNKFIVDDSCKCKKWY